SRDGPSPSSVACALVTRRSPCSPVLSRGRSWRASLEQTRSALPRGVLSNRRSSIVLHGEMTVVGSTQQADVVDGVSSSHSERIAMMKLETVALAAAPALLVDVAAARAVAFVDGTADR